MSAAIERARRDYAPFTWPKVPRYKLLLARLLGTPSSFETDYGAAVTVSDWGEKIYVVGIRDAPRPARR